MKMETKECLLGGTISRVKTHSLQRRVGSTECLLGDDGTKPRPRRLSWSYKDRNSSSDCFMRFGNIEEDKEKCYQGMNEKTRVDLVTTNRAVVEDIQLNFHHDKDIRAIGGEELKTFDAVVFDVLKVLPDDIANQMTLIDLPLFKKIQPEELTSCMWVSKKKNEYCANVVNYIKKFNHMSFWVTREILSSNTAKKRAEKVAYFIKVAKRLLELNNINCLKAVVSGLKSTPIYRLTKTWNLVPKRDKERLDKLGEFVSEDNTNKEKLRAYIDSARLPCIPYLGMYLTDLTYINSIHPFTGGLDYQRTNKMNEILRKLADFQQSDYDIKEIGHIVKYLNSVKYIEELQKFMEEDNYKLSLQIETPVALREKASTLSRRSRREVLSESDETQRLHPKSAVTRTHTLNGAPHSSHLNPKSSSLNLPFRSPSPDKKFKPGHRKVKSLGNNQQFLTSLSVLTPPSSSSSSNCGSRFNLVDDSLVEEHNEITASKSYDSGLDEQEVHPIIQSTELEEGEVLTPHLPKVYFKLQGYLKRKPCLKNGSKPKVSSWQRYWCGITSSCLVYFLPKYRGFGGHEREHFRSEPHKVLALHGCSAFPVATSGDTFQLTDERGDNVYRFQAGNKSNLNLWCKYIREAADGVQLFQPQNLIVFDESDDDTPL